jgi:ankyrin repeat protein
MRRAILFFIWRRPAAHGYEEILKTILPTGRTEVDSRNKSGDTPLQLAAREGSLMTSIKRRFYRLLHRKITRLLLDAGANPHSLNYSGQSPLSIALQKGHETVANHVRK